ncbi:MAG TPA: hypothetical protein VIE63_02390 [Ramlibacter sp.]|jgi:hypothetical protein
MFEWLSRLFKPKGEPPVSEIARARAARRKTSASSGHHRAQTGPAPLPEVMGEGNSQEDWSEWESSMMGLDSQMQHLPESARIYEKEAEHRYTKPAPLVDDKDTFGKVGKNRDI